MVSLPGQSFPVWICSSGTGRSRFTYWAYAYDPTNRTTFLSQLSTQGMATRPTGSQPVSLKLVSHFQRGLEVLPAQQRAPYKGTWKPCTSPPLEFKLKTSAVQDPQSSYIEKIINSGLRMGIEQRVRRNSVRWKGRGAFREALFTAAGTCRVPRPLASTALPLLDCRQQLPSHVVPGTSVHTGTFAAQSIHFFQGDHST